MKRNILTLGLAALIGCSAFTSFDAVAKQQRVLSDGTLPKKEKGINKYSALQQVRSKRGSQQLNGIRGVRSGMTDLKKLRPAYTTGSTRSIAEPRGHFIGAVGSYAAMETFDQAFLAQIDVKTGSISPLFTSAGLLNGNDYDIQGGCVRDGIYYTPYLVGEDHVIWNRFDLETGSQLPAHDFGAGVTAAYAYSMAYNEAEDLFYCLSIDFTTGADGVLSVFDPNENFDLIASTKLNTNSFVGGLAYNPVDQLVYAVDDSGRISIVEKGKANMIEVGQFLNDMCPIDGGATTQITYSPLDECFVMVTRDPVKKVIGLGYFALEDTEDGMYEAFRLYDGPELGTAQYQVPYFVTLICTDPYAPNDATELPAAPEFNFEGAALKGAVNITVPSFFYSGASIPANEKVTVKVTDNGEEVLNGEFAPGSVQTINKEFTQGLHTFAVTCSIKGENSPTRTVKYYIGNDNPMAPTNLKLEGDVLSWTAPGAVGQHKGFVETSALTYDVYFDSEKQNSEPITGTSFTITPPEDLGYIKIRVVANANGLSSEAATSDNVIGKPMSLPCVLEPTVEESNLFQTINSKKGNTGWEFVMDGGYEFQCWVGYQFVADDWLFMPVINFPTTDHLYNLSFAFRNAQYEGNEALDIYLTQNVTSDTSKMVNLFSETGLDFPSEKNYSFNFGVPEAGAWYIAFHCKSSGANGGGIALYNFAVNSLNDKSSNVPGDSEKVEIIPADKGDLKATINISVPTKNIVGGELDANEEISYKITSGKYSVVAKGIPGSVATTEIDVEKEGFNSFEIVPSNANGEGLARTFRHYVGLDTPLCPTEIKIDPAADNKTFTLTWNRPGAVGQNGGYVDVDGLSYNVYNVTGIAYNLLGVTKDLTYTGKMSGKQNIYNLGPSAVNKAGESNSTQLVCEILGDAYLLPLVEEFGNTGFSYEPFYYNLTPPYQNLGMQPLASILNTSYAHNCEEDCKNGAIAVYNTSRVNCPGEVVFPKFSTSGVADASISVRILDYPHTPDVAIWARCEGQTEYVKIGDLDLKKPANAAWVDAAVELPASFLNKGWVQFVMRFAFTTDPDEYAFIDSYTVSQNIDTDLGVKETSGPSVVYTGETYDYSLRLVNGGKDPIRVGAGTVYTRLKDKDGNVLERSTRPTPRIFSYEEALAPYKLEVKEAYTALSPLTLEVEVSLPGDEVAWNNISTYSIEVKDHEAPVVRDLVGKWDDAYTEVTLNWSEPNLDHSNYDGFELYQSCQNGEKLGQFRNVDMDKQIPFCFSGLRWEGDNLPQAWHVIDVNDIYPWKNDARMSPHGGNKYIMARTPEFNEETGDGTHQAADWLISPEVVPGSEISFWYGTIDSQYTEFIELWVSSTDDTLGDEIVKKDESTSVGATCGSFRYVRTFSKSGSEAWEFVKEQLPADAKYFALVYRSIDGFGAMLDDLTFEQKGSAQSEVDRYAVWSLSNDDWKTWKCLENNIPANTYSYVDKNASKDATNTYYVLTYVKSDDSSVKGPRSNPARVFGQGVDQIADGSRSVTGGKGCININGHANEVAKVYTTDGKLVRELTVKGAAEQVEAAAGVYVIRIGKANYKVIVK